MIRAEQLKTMPAGHEFAKGEIDLPELSPNTLRWVAKWTGRDWVIRVAPSRHSFREVSTRGKIVDVEKYIQRIQPASADAMALYFK